MAVDNIQIAGYEMLRLLGSGGMSTVYLALQRSLDRKVAIKLMRRSGDQASADARQIERRFLLEGRMMAKLPHRNIVAVYDIVSDETIAYIAMEYLGGGALTERMRSGIALADAISVIVQIAGALEFAHSHGVVHRDLKPANIMFRDSGTPVLTDFGIARYQDGSATKLTQTGMLVGTPTYMSPEQINGLPVDGRADQYSLGILFYELLTGSPPFRADTPIAVLMAHLTQTPPPLPPEFRSFQDVIDRMLAKNRDERYEDLKTFSDDLKSRLVHSDTLLMRLQGDPNQSASDQLRALGFYTSTPTGEGLREALISRQGTSSGSRSVLKTPPPPVATASAPVQWQAMLRRPWVLALGVAVAILLAVGLWFAFAPHANRTMTADEQELVSMWIDRAQHRVKNNELVVAAPDSDGSAFQYVQKILQKDPANAKAQALLDDIAKQLQTQSEAALAENKFDVATDLGNQALLVRPDDAALNALKTRIAEAQKGAANPVPMPAPAAVEPATAQVAREHLEKVLSAASTLSAQELRAAVGEFAQLIAGDPTNKSALALRPRLIDAVGARLQHSADAVEFDGWSALLTEQKKVLDGDPAYATLEQALPGWRAKVVAAAQAQIEAQRGELVLNAYPWGKVESVVDTNRQSLPLPADAVTPLTLTLPAGSYVITFRHPQASRPTQVIAKVEAKKRSVANAAFPTISTQEYFSRAGW